jgi:hypothetical protein
VPHDEIDVIRRRVVNARVLKDQLLVVERKARAEGVRIRDEGEEREKGRKAEGQKGRKAEGQKGRKANLPAL